MVTGWPGRAQAKLSVARAKQHGALSSRDQPQHTKVAPRKQKRSPSRRQLWAPCSALTDIQRDCQWAESAACLSSVCACAEVRPLLCLVVPRPYTCVYVCVCRCVLPCLSFLCMCRSGVWLSCRLCVLVPLFSREQCLVSWCPPCPLPLEP